MALAVNPIRPGSRQFKTRQFRMTPILERFNTLVSYFMCFACVTELM